MTDELRSLCKDMAEWHVQDGDECGVIARRVLELLTTDEAAAESLRAHVSKALKVMLEITAAEEAFTKDTGLQCNDRLSDAIEEARAWIMDDFHR